MKKKWVIGLVVGLVVGTVFGPQVWARFRGGTA